MEKIALVTPQDANKISEDSQAEINATYGASAKGYAAVVEKQLDVAIKEAAKLGFHTARIQVPLKDFQWIKLPAREFICEQAKMKISGDLEKAGYGNIRVQNLYVLPEDQVAGLDVEVSW